MSPNLLLKRTGILVLDLSTEAASFGHVGRSFDGGMDGEPVCSLGVADIVDSVG